MRRRRPTACERSATSSDTLAPGQLARQLGDGQSGTLEMIKPDMKVTDGALTYMLAALLWGSLLAGVLPLVSRP